jgi:hypothetical protein
MRLEIIDNELNHNNKLLFAATYFPKKDCSSIAFMNFKSLKKAMHDDDVIYFTIKSPLQANGENLYAVGFTTETPKIKHLDVKFLLFNK